MLDQVGARQPMREFPRNVTGFYTRSLHRDHEGEWEFDLAWKPVESSRSTLGWLRAIRLGHARLHRGLDVPCPALVLSSGGTARPAEMSDDVHRHDIVLDVPQIRQWSPAVGPHVTLRRRRRTRGTTWCCRCPRSASAVYDELDRWHIGVRRPAAEAAPPARWVAA